MDSKSAEYNDKKLIESINTGLSDKNYHECVKSMCRLGQVLRASAVKEIEQINTYKSLFKTIATIFKLGEKTLLSLRILSLRVLTSSALALWKQDTTNGSFAYTMILKKYRGK